MVYFTATESDTRAVQHVLMDVYTELDKHVAYLIATYKRDADYVDVIEQNVAPKLYKGKKRYNWKQILKTCADLPDHLIRAYEDVMNFQLLSSQRIPEDVVSRHLPPPGLYISKQQKYVNLNRLCGVYGQFSETFILEHSEHLHMKWYKLCASHKFSTQLLFKLHELADMERVGPVLSMYQELPEAFMIQHAEVLDWHRIAKYQNISDDFIMRHRHRLPWRYLRNNIHISPEHKAMLKEALYSQK
jgi:hypothetical protein